MRVGFNEGFAESGAGRILAGVLKKGVGDDAGGLLAGLLADRVGAHAVGDEEEVAALPPLVVVGGELHRQVVLVVAAADSHVRQTGVLNLIEAVHRQNPGRRAAFACLYATPLADHCIGRPRCGSVL